MSQTGTYNSAGLSDDEQRTILREVMGACPQVNVMPSGTGYIEAVCVWADRSAYVLLCQDTHRVLRFHETVRPPLCHPKDTSKRRKRISSTPRDTADAVSFYFVKENEK